MNNERWAGGTEKRKLSISCSHKVNLLFLHNISNRKCKIQAQLILRVGSVLIVHKTAKVATAPCNFFFAKTCVLLTLKEEQSVQLGVTFSVKVENEDK